MAERRMFAKTIVLSDAFLDMPMSARCLYFTLGMFADDDGFINNPKSIMRQCGATTDDMNILLLKKFLLSFDDGVIVIKHWRIHNYIQNDRYTPTKYTEHKQQLQLDNNKAYTKCIQNGYNMYTQVSIGKDSIDKDNIEESKEKKSTRFIPPTLEEVKEYCTERHNNVDPQRFVDFYESKGWMVGKNKMKSWKACVRTWEQRDNTVQTAQAKENINQRDYNKEYLAGIVNDMDDLDL